MTMVLSFKRQTSRTRKPIPGSWKPRVTFFYYKKTL